jgi:hypothetical protein
MIMRSGRLTDGYRTQAVTSVQTIHKFDFINLRSSIHSIYNHRTLKTSLLGPSAIFVVPNVVYLR